MRSAILHTGFLALVLALGGPPAAAQGFRLLEIDGVRMKWDDPRLGTPAEVSYGFAEAPGSYPDAINCGELEPLAELGQAWQHDAARLEQLAAAAFEMWSSNSGIRFRKARGREAPDILIGTQGAPRRIAFTNVWFDVARAKGGVASLTKATICFNPTLDWDSEDPRIASRLDFTVVLAHEIGHAIGLDHPGPGDALMGYRDDGLVDGLMVGDIAGSQVLYGPPTGPGRDDRTTAVR